MHACCVRACGRRVTDHALLQRTLTHQEHSNSVRFALSCCLSKPPQASFGSVRASFSVRSCCVSPLAPNPPPSTPSPPPPPPPPSLLFLNYLITTRHHVYSPQIGPTATAAARPHGHGQRAETREEREERRERICCCCQIRCRQLDNYTPVSLTQSVLCSVQFVQFWLTTLLLSCVPFCTSFPNHQQSPPPPSSSTLASLESAIGPGQFAKQSSPRNPWFVASSAVRSSLSSGFQRQIGFQSAFDIYKPFWASLPLRDVNSFFF
ncbi:hypothetical protein FPQ18DRAFT_9976 [Pyronema domesticum]|nr:hypothetical protein FPQ18DRAFT_9976 [Pyronema domesticum]